MESINLYRKSLSWLDKLNQNKIKPGLERIRKLMLLIKNPQRKLNIITVGGTNAKGSTCYNLSKTLMQTDKKIGCFTSPHLHSVRERFEINGEIISKQDFCKLVQKLKKIMEKHDIKATYFEVLTAIAYLYFNAKEVDYAIMEIGLGGEWDAVNIGDPKIAILTTLGLDHTEYLGNTLEEIATTKAKIVRENTIVITGWEEKYLKYIPKSKKIIRGKSVKEWIKFSVKCLNLDIEAIVSSVPGRMEKYSNFTMDNAHNTQAITYLGKKDSNYQRVILGMLNDKDVEAFVSKLPKKAIILACELNSVRSFKSEEIAKICAKLGIKCNRFKSVKEAILAIENQKTLITGSFYTVSEARKHFQLKGYSEL